MKKIIEKIKKSAAYVWAKKIALTVWVKCQKLFLAACFNFMILGAKIEAAWKALRGKK